MRIFTFLEEGEAGAETEREGEIRSRISCFVLLPPPLPPPPPNNNLSLAPQHRFLGLDQKKGLYMRTVCVGGVVGGLLAGRG